MKNGRPIKKGDDMYNDFFEYPTLSEDQILLQQSILEEGEHDFVVIKAEKKNSKSSGNPMIELQLKVTGQNGRKHVLFDWFTCSEKMAYKVKHFWESVGSPENYSGRNSVSDFIGREGRLETGTRKNDNGKSQAVVKDYIPEKNLETKKNLDDELDDGLPF